MVPCLALGDDATDLDFAKGAYTRGDYKSASKILQPLAAKGNVSAQANLGFMYGHGYGVSKSYKNAAIAHASVADHSVLFLDPSHGFFDIRLGALGATEIEPKRIQTGEPTDGAGEVQ